jgi:hypothetical protein
VVEQALGKGTEMDALRRKVGQIPKSGGDLPIFTRKKLTMRFLLICFSMLCAQQQGLAQAPADSLSFPESWAGDWVGTLDIFNAKGKAQSVAMQLEIHRIDSSREGRYTFGMVYGSKAQDWRPYEIVPVAPERGLWKVDEKNSIVMESYLLGPKLLCWFVVQGSRILCTYEKTDANTLIFEVMAGPEKAASSTGNTKQGEEDIPEVQTFPFAAFQRAILKRT